jgi:stage II sporulation protein AA (anti-sigma F factor antagonist)
VEEAGRGRLRLVGELDFASAPQLRGGLAALDGDVELDCSGVTFIDCAGLGVLEERQRACQAAGVRMYLVDPSPCVTTLVALVGLDGCFALRSGLDS